MFRVVRSEGGLVRKEKRFAGDLIYTSGKLHCQVVSDRG